MLTIAGLNLLSILRYQLKLTRWSKQFLGTNKKAIRNCWWLKMIYKSWQLKYIAFCRLHKENRHLFQTVIKDMLYWLCPFADFNYLTGSLRWAFVKGGFELSFYGGLKMYDSGGLRIDRCQTVWLPLDLNHVWMIDKAVQNRLCSRSTLEDGSPTW